MIENPDKLPPYWRELKYKNVGGHVFRGPPPKFELMLSAEATHRLLKENLKRLKEFKK
jgi:hypothetical protein